MTELYAKVDSRSVTLFGPAADESIPWNIPKPCSREKVAPRVDMTDRGEKKYLNKLLDARRLPRYSCDFALFGLLFEDPNFLSAHARDIGLGGLRLQANRRLREGQLLKLKPRAGIPGVHGRIARVEDLTAGIEFIAPPVQLARSRALTALAEADPGHNRRKYLRVSCDLSAQVTVGAKTPSRGWLRDLSLGGAMLETDGTLPAGQRLELAIGPLPGLQALQLSAVVRESRPARKRIEFVESSADQLRLLGRYMVALLRKTRAS